MEQRLTKLEERVAGLETRVAVAESTIKDIKETLSSIQSNTTWILRLIIGAIVMGVLGLIIKGGI